MGKRKGSHGSGTWSVPGGHLEFGETWEEAATREVLEETGIKIKNVSFLAATNDVMKENKHYISVWMTADFAGGTPQIMEPDKWVDQGWYDIKKLPSPLFEPCWQNLKAFKPELFE